MTRRGFSHYEAPAGAEAETELGSRGRVLRNRLGIRRKREMECGILPHSGSPAKAAGEFAFSIGDARAPRDTGPKQQTEAVWPPFAVILGAGAGFEPTTFRL